MIRYSFDPKLKVRTISDLLVAPPTVVLVNKFDEASAKEFRKDFEAALNTGQTIVPVMIDSYGGAVYSLLSMIDTIKSSPVPVATIAVGKAMSCGQMLLTFGTEGLRFAAPEATIMMHDVASMGHGKVEEIKADAKEADRLQVKLFTMAARNCGKPDNYFLNLMDEKKHADVIMDAEECKKHNIINHIRLPKFGVKVSVDYSFE